MEPEVTDIWFRSPLSLAEIARRLGLREVTEDAEDYWAWVIGTLDDVRLDITRTHARSAGNVDTRVFVLDSSFTEPLITELVGRLQAFVLSPIICGRWEYCSGNEFDLVVVRECSPADGTTGSPGQS